MVIIFVVLFILAGALSFIICSGLFWLICWAFSLTFSWKIAFGFWIILVIIHNIIQNNNKN